MKKNRLINCELDIYEETLDNGLQIYVVPKNNINSVYVTFSTKYGSVYDKFIPFNQKDIITVPKGVAHFLEHKVFEQKDGKDPFNFYSERGCDCNANTSNMKTTYLFSGTEYIDEGIEYLLDFVQAPYFTDENVKKEKGIIAQEIKMYDDIPYWRIYEGVIYNTFHINPIKYPIAGTIESIEEITKEDLYTCYNTFYHPSNMFVVVVGNVSPEHIIEIIKNNQAKKEYAISSKIVIESYQEPDSVLIPYKEEKMDVVIPKVSVSYKINYTNINLDINIIKSYLRALTNIKLGPTSFFNENLRKNQIINNEIDVNIINTDQHLVILVMAETTKPEEFTKLLDNELKNMKINENELNRKKKVSKSNVINRSDSIYAVNEKIMNNIIDYKKIIYDDYEIIDALNMNDLNYLITKLDFSNKSVYVVNSNE